MRLLALTNPFILSPLIAAVLVIAVLVALSEWLALLILLGGIQIGVIFGIGITMAGMAGE